MNLKKIDVQIIALVVIVGALVSKSYPFIGLWIGIAAIATYVAVNAKWVIAHCKDFKNQTTWDKVRVLVFIALTLIIIDGAINEAASYFFVLLLLALDYIITREEKKSE